MREDRSDSSLDIVAVQADDALIDALNAEHRKMVQKLGEVLVDVDAGLATVLRAWQQNVRRKDNADPDEPLVDVDTALALVSRTQSSAPRRRSVLVPFAAATAVAAITFSGLGLAARTAECGSALWPVAVVLYSGSQDTVCP